MSRPPRDTAFRRWFLDIQGAEEPEGFYEDEKEAAEHQHVHPWWRVM